MVMSPIDILNPNLERFPKFAQVKAMECTIRPGDILFMPAFWWHEVKSTPDTEQHRNLAVNFWYEMIIIIIHVQFTTKGIAIKCIMGKFMCNIIIVLCINY